MKKRSLTLFPLTLIDGLARRVIPTLRESLVRVSPGAEGGAK
jgi:hypothetical protein